MKHPYAEILIAIADGKEIQWRNGEGTWATCAIPLLFDVIERASKSPSRFRIKPASITVNGIECEAPVKNGDWSVTVQLGVGEGETRIGFSSSAARDAAYSALLKPFGGKS
jgi:hypothetical protein